MKSFVKLETSTTYHHAFAVNQKKASKHMWMHQQQKLPQWDSNGPRMNIARHFDGAEKL